MCLHGKVEAVNEEGNHERENWRMGKHPRPGRRKGVSGSAERHEQAQKNKIPENHHPQRRSF